MATRETINDLAGIYNRYMEFNETGLLRPSFGDLSIKEEFSEKIVKFRDRLSSANEVANQVGDINLKNFIQIAKDIMSGMNIMAEYNKDDYVTNREKFLKEMEKAYSLFDQSWMPIQSALIDKKGILGGGAIDDQVARMIEDGKKRVNEEAQKILNAANEKAQDVMASAHQTATGVSVKEAQRQFKEALPDLRKQVITWIVLSSAGVASIIILAYCFFNLDITGKSNFEIAYAGVLRVSILAFLGTITAFCVKMLRASLYMKEKNKHRVRVANSIEAFIGAASNDDQKDAILGQLVDSVVQFGSSGLISKEDEGASKSKMNIGSIFRTLSNRPPT